MKLNAQDLVKSTSTRIVLWWPTIWRVTRGIWVNGQLCLLAQKWPKLPHLKATMCKLATSQLEKRKDRFHSRAQRVCWARPSVTYVKKVAPFQLVQTQKWRVQLPHPSTGVREGSQWVTMQKRVQPTNWTISSRTVCVSKVKARLFQMQANRMDQVSNSNPLSQAKASYRIGKHWVSTWRGALWARVSSTTTCLVWSKRLMSSSTPTIKSRFASAVPTTTALAAEFRATQSKFCSVSSVRPPTTSSASEQTSWPSRLRANLSFVANIRI